MQASGIKMCAANSPEAEAVATTTITKLNADVEVETQEKQRIKLNLFAKLNKRRKRRGGIRGRKRRVENERVSYKHRDVTLSSSLHSHIRSVGSNRQVLLVVLHAY